MTENSPTNTNKPNNPSQDSIPPPSYNTDTTDSSTASISSTDSFYTSDDHSTTLSISSATSDAGINENILPTIPNNITSASSPASTSNNTSPQEEYTSKYKKALLHIQQQPAPANFAACLLSCMCLKLSPIVF